MREIRRKKSISEAHRQGMGLREGDVVLLVRDRKVQPCVVSTCYKTGCERCVFRGPWICHYYLGRARLPLSDGINFASLIPAEEVLE